MNRLSKKFQIQPSRHPRVLNKISKLFVKLALIFDGSLRIAMDNLLSAIHYFDIFMEDCWCFFESVNDIFGIFGYIVALFELVACLCMIIELMTSLESKIFGTNFYSMQRIVFKLILQKMRWESFWGKC